MVGETEVGDPVGRRVGKLLAAADGSWRGGGAHGRRWQRRRRDRTRVWGGGGGGGGSKFERATSEASTRGTEAGRWMGSGRFVKETEMLGEIFLDSNFEPRPREAEWGEGATEGDDEARRFHGVGVPLPVRSAWAETATVCLPLLG